MMVSVDVVLLRKDSMFFVEEHDNMAGIQLLNIL